MEDNLTDLESPVPDYSGSTSSGANPNSVDFLFNLETYVCNFDPISTELLLLEESSRLISRGDFFLRHANTLDRPNIINALDQIKSSNPNFEIYYRWKDKIILAKGYFSSPFYLSGALTDISFLSNKLFPPITLKDLGVDIGQNFYLYSSNANLLYSTDSTLEDLVTKEAYLKELVAQFNQVNSLSSHQGAFSLYRSSAFDGDCVLVIERLLNSALNSNLSSSDLLLELQEIVNKYSNK